MSASNGEGLLMGGFEVVAGVNIDLVLHLLEQLLQSIHFVRQVV